MDNNKESLLFSELVVIALTGFSSSFESITSASLALISVSPPLAFSAAYDVNTTFVGSITSLSFTFPKSLKLSLNAPAKRDDPIVLANFLPCVALYS